MPAARTSKPADNAPWDLPLVLDAMLDALRAAEQDLAEQQSPRGIDALRELDVQAILAAGLSTHGWGVLREVAYAGDVAARSPLTKRERCDLVLTRSAGQSIADPVALLKERDAMASTLFADAMVDAPPNDARVPPDAALWIEAKVVGQFEFRSGVPGPNTAYGSSITRSLFQDLAKLSHEPTIHAGCAVLVLFAENSETAQHDVRVALHRVLDQGVSFRPLLRAGVPILDRIGNAWCEVALVPSQPV